MTLSIIFEFGKEIVEMKIKGTNCFFKTKQSFGQFVPISGIRLDKKGVIREHPDLVDNPNWKEEAIDRFESKLKSYNTEMERMKYIVNDLRKYGYKPLYYRREGFRKPIKIN